MTSTHSIYKEFDEQLKTMIGTYANNNPAPRFAKIENVSPDEKYVDVSIGDGVIKAVERFGSKPVVGTKCILVFMNGNYEEPVAICNEYIEETLCYNLLNNGCFQKVTTDGFEDWTGGTISTLNYYYNQSTVRLLPETNIISSPINITSLEDKELGAVSEIMLFYFYIGSISIEVIDNDTGEPVTFAPENLGNKKEILEPVESWHYARTHFLLREHKNVTVKFTNTSKTQSAYLDGVRLWKPDFSYWYPSEKDEYEIGNMLKKNYSTILKDPVSWKANVNKIIRDIDDRLKNIENSSDVNDDTDNGSDDGSDDGQDSPVIPEYLDPLVEALRSTWYNPTDAVTGETFIHGFNGEVNADISSIWEDTSADVNYIILYDMLDGVKYDFPRFVISSSSVQQIYGASPPTSKSSLSEALRTDFIKFVSRVSTVDGQNNVNIVLQVNHSDSTQEEYLLF